MGVVVEIAVQVISWRPQICQSVGPCPEGPGVVAGSWTAGAGVEAEIAPIGRAPLRTVSIEGIDQYPRRPVIFQDPPYLVDVPTRVAHLDGHLSSCWEMLESRPKRGGVCPQVGGELEEDRPRPFPWPTQDVLEPPDWFPSVAKPFDVGYVPARLDGNDEIVRHRITPRTDGLGPRQVVEDAIDLNRLESLGVVGQPAGFGKIVGIEAALPVVVLPSGRPDEDRRQRPPNADSS